MSSKERKLMEDQEIISEFLIESNDNLGRLDQEMVELERRPKDGELLASIFRTFHTIKGTCGFLGFGKLERVAHQAENVLSQLRSGSISLTSELATLILEAVDIMRHQLQSIEATGHEVEEDSSHLCARLETAARTGISTPKLESPEPGAAQPKASASVADSAIRVDVGLLDKLMNLVGELVLTRNQILQFGARQEDTTLTATTQRLNLITSELQEGVMKTRMQPIGVVWNKLPRLVRDVARACGKQIALEMEGSSTELDKTIIEAIKDPLTHIVRNSGDHGIERPEVRIARGKPALGRICLRAFHEGGQVIIEISDDGAGVDPEKIKLKAIQNGLIRSDQPERMGEREALNLLFLPGFSTAEHVTSVSGRGVGMDVVRTNIEKIGGTVDLSSRLGEGTTVKLKIPLTLAIIPGLVVTLGDRRSSPRAGEANLLDGDFVIPQASLVELVRLEGEAARKSIERIRGTTVYRLRGNLLPVVYLRKILGLEDLRSENGVVNIAILQAEDRQFGLVVDGVKDTQEIVVKPLGKYLKGLNCYAGATIMGDGRVALILDVLGLAHICGEVGDGCERTLLDDEVRYESLTDGRQTYLLFRAGPFERLAVPLSLVARLEEFPLSRVERAGSRMVVQYRGKILPLVPLAPILAPEREDTASVQDPVQAIVFNDTDRSIGLVVDQLIDIVDDTVTIRQASSRKGLLGSAVIGKRVTDMLDLNTVIREISDIRRRESTDQTTVMLADGSPFSRGILRSSLEMAGYRVLECSSASEALDQLARFKISVVLTTLDLPGGGGQELLKKMRGEPSFAAVPAVVLTNSAEETSVYKEATGSFQEYLIRGDREAMLRSIDRLARALTAQTPAGEFVGDRV